MYIGSMINYTGYKMKKSLIVLLALVATSAFASDNWENSSGVNWRNGDGTLCWRDSNWTPATAAKGCDGALVAKAVAQSKITLQAATLFDFDKSVLKPEGIAALDVVLQDIKGVKLEVLVAVGNTDSIGTDAYNLALGQRRASAVKAYLVSKGIPADRVYTESKGKSNPVASNETAGGRALNRRVDLEVVGTK
jgi:OOP family OmpA-OmpF porin